MWKRLDSFCLERVDGWTLKKKKSDPSHILILYVHGKTVYTTTSATFSPFTSGLAGLNALALFPIFDYKENKSKHSPLLPVMTGTLRGRERQSKIIGFCTQGIRKWVPSPTTMSWTPRNRSKITALCPASTSEVIQKAPQQQQTQNTQRTRVIQPLHPCRPHKTNYPLRSTGETFLMPTEELSRTKSSCPHYPTLRKNQLSWCKWLRVRARRSQADYLPRTWPYYFGSWTWDESGNRCWDPVPDSASMHARASEWHWAAVPERSDEAKCRFTTVCSLRNAYKEWTSMQSFLGEQAFGSIWAR